MRIATWNVNSIRPRLEQLAGFVKSANPDVLCLQETKVEDDRFPSDAIRELGFEPAIFGERTYNGVAILARFGLRVEDVKRNLDGDEANAHRRVIAGTIDGVRVINVYAPNGQSVGTSAWEFKLAWYERLRLELENSYAPAQELVVLGDFNVAPRAIDVYDPPTWESTVLFHPGGRAALERLFAWGLTDVFRDHHADEPGAYSWWDYRLGMFKRNRGLRIDLALATPSLAARVKSVVIDRTPRDQPRASDHAPVVVEID